MTSSIKLRLPSTITSASAAAKTDLQPPPLPFMLTTWHVTHSTLPMWRKARNVRITYTELPPKPPSTAPRLDDLVAYQDLNGDKEKTVRGVDTPAEGAGAAGWAYDWRGKGWLMIASSHWEVLGYGDALE